MKFVRRSSSLLQWQTTWVGYSDFYPQRLLTPAPTEATFAITGVSTTNFLTASNALFSISGHSSVVVRAANAQTFAITGTTTCTFVSEVPRWPIYVAAQLTAFGTPPDVTASATPSLAYGLVGGGVPGALDIPAHPSVSASVGGVALTPVDYWYNRIWVIPAVLNPTNPRPNVDIPFGIFNAYFAANTLESITAIGATGLSLDLSATSFFDYLEYRDVNLRVAPTAPAKVSASYLFTFDSGSGTLTFSAQIADFVAVFPEDKATETLEWKTSIITGYDGSEQRIALRTSPRRALEFSFLADQTERARQYRRWHRSLGGRFIAPQYWLGAQITVATAGGASRIYFDPALTDVRDGGYVAVIDPVEMTGELLTIDTVQVDGATLVAPTAGAFTTRMVACPGLNCRLVDGGGLTMNTVAGVVKINAETLYPDAPFQRPGAAPSLTTFDGFDVLDVQPVARGDSAENFTAKYALFDNVTGVTAIDQNWTHPFVSGGRTFRVARDREAGIMDWWRAFLDARRGQAVAFLMPTWQPDLWLASTPDGTPHLVFEAESGAEWLADLFPRETYKRLAILSAAGWAYRKVSAAVTNDDGTVTATLDSPYGSTLAEQEVEMVSFLNVVRFGDDTVRWTHLATRSDLELTIRTVDA